MGVVDVSLWHFLVTSALLWFKYGYMLAIPYMFVWGLKIHSMDFKFGRFEYIYMYIYSI